MIGLTTTIAPSLMTSASVTTATKSMIESRLLVCGDRNWSDYKLIEKVVADYVTKHTTHDTCVVVIHGGARGADHFGGVAAINLGCEVLVFPADWKRYGRGAGPIRNQQMIDEGCPDFAIVFHDDLERSKGTADMVKRLIKNKVDYYHVTHSSDLRFPWNEGLDYDDD